MQAHNKFASDALRHPLFIGDVARLQAKLESSGGLLREYWQDFRKTHLADPKMRADMIFLAAMTSPGLRGEARQRLKDYYTSLPAHDAANDVQFHTWCRCGTVVRRAAFFDWLASAGAWSPAEIEEAAECFLGFGYKHAFMTLTSRMRSSNNQAISMALYCAVVGFLFGYKLSNHPTGRFLFDYGLGRIPDLLGLFPGDGYAGEGSTYTSHVNTPLAFWTCEFLKQITGRDYFDTPFAPNGNSLRKMLEIELHILSPGGLLAPWDHYGWQRAINGSPFAYLARASGDARYLSIIPSLGLWPDPGYLAWGSDDPMWTLIWWPEQFKDHDDRDLPAGLFGWFLPRTGCALDDCRRRSRLMQVWDISSGSIAAVGRAQVNPNHIMFDYASEPVLEDGIQDGDANPWRFPPDKVLGTLSQSERERFALYLSRIAGMHNALERAVLGTSPGLIGCANAIVVDEEPWFWPGGPRVGVPEFHASHNGLQAVTADCASFYQPRYDVTRARRTSLWTDAGAGIVLDTLEAGSEHTWRWQAYLRPSAELRGDSAAIRLPGGRNVLIAWEHGPEVRIEPVEGFPRTEEKRSLRLDLVTKGRSARFAVVIAPKAKAASVRRNSNSVEVVIDGEKHSFVVENFDGERTPIAGAAATAAFAWAGPGGALVELAGGKMSPVPPDTFEIDDIDEERDIQRPEIRKLLEWTADPAEPGDSRLSQVDACLAQLAAKKPDAASLLTALQSPFWPVQAAAAQVLGVRGIAKAKPALRALLEAEHAKPYDDIYPPDNAVIPGRSTEDIAKRWRLKAALIVALGRLGDRQAVPLLGRIIADSRDFYTVYSVAAQALGRIGGHEALAALRPALDESEVNTHSRALAAIRAIQSQATRSRT